jgi:hypothetical protein
MCFCSRYHPSIGLGLFRAVISPWRHVIFMVGCTQNMTLPVQPSSSQVTIDSTSAPLDSPNVDRLVPILDELEPAPNAESRACLISLARHRQPRGFSDLSVFKPGPRHHHLAYLPCLVSPKDRTASVLVLLSIDQNGEILVTLTTRSMSLRASQLVLAYISPSIAEDFHLLGSHPGDTALPGGRSDPTDGSVEATAVRCPGNIARVLPSG